MSRRRQVGVETLKQLRELIAAVNPADLTTDDHINLLDLVERAMTSKNSGGGVSFCRGA